MKIFLLSLLFACYGFNAKAQIEKVFQYKDILYSLERTNERYLRLNIQGPRDTTYARLEIFNTGRYDYHPQVWHLVDSSLYALEMIRTDVWFVRFNLLRFRIPLNASPDAEKIEKSQAYLHYNQKLEAPLFLISEKEMNRSKPVYFDIFIDRNGKMIQPIYEVKKQEMAIYTKTISAFEKEVAEGLPFYKQLDTWKEAYVIHAELTPPFRMFEENGKYYFVDNERVLYVLKNDALQKQKTILQKNFALVFDREGRRATRLLPLKSGEKNGVISGKRMRVVRR